MVGYPTIPLMGVDAKDRLNLLLGELSRLADAIKAAPERDERIELLHNMRVALDETDRLILDSRRNNLAQQATAD